MARMQPVREKPLLYEVVAIIAALIFGFLSVGRLWVLGRLWRSWGSLSPRRRSPAALILVSVLMLGVLSLVLAVVMLLAGLAPDHLEESGRIIGSALVLGAVLTFPGIYARVPYRRDPEIAAWLLAPKRE